MRAARRRACAQWIPEWPPTQAASAQSHFDGHRGPGRNSSFPQLFLTRNNQRRTAPHTMARPGPTAGGRTDGGESKSCQNWRRTRISPAPARPGRIEDFTTSPREQSGCFHPPVGARSEARSPCSTAPTRPRQYSCESFRAHSALLALRARNRQGAPGGRFTSPRRPGQSRGDTRRSGQSPRTPRSGERLGPAQAPRRPGAPGPPAR